MMSEQFGNLSERERALLMKAPVLLAVLAAGKNGNISELEKETAIKQADIRSYSAPEILQSYYKEVEEHFVQNFNDTVQKYSPLNDANLESLRLEAYSINYIINKLDVPFAVALRESLASYAGHIDQADKTFVENYLFPFMNR